MSYVRVTKTFSPARKLSQNFALKAFVYNNVKGLSAVFQDTTGSKNANGKSERRMSLDELRNALESMQKHGMTNPNSAESLKTWAEELSGIINELEAFGEQNLPAEEYRDGKGLVKEPPSKKRKKTPEPSLS